MKGRMNRKCVLKDGEHKELRQRRRVGTSSSQMSAGIGKVPVHVQRVVDLDVATSTTKAEACQECIVNSPAVFRSH